MAGNRRRFLLPLWLAASALTACAGGNQTKPELVDPIIIPDLAVEVDRVSLFNGEDWAPLNRRMLVVWSGRTPYLLVFNAQCTGLVSSHPLIVNTTNSTLYARFDYIITEHGTRCHIDRMYQVTKEDVTALKEELKR